jgi:hypothetical protein
MTGATTEAGTAYHSKQQNSPLFLNGAYVVQAKVFCVV